MLHFQQLQFFFTYAFIIAIRYSPDIYSQSTRTSYMYRYTSKVYGVHQVYQLHRMRSRKTHVSNNTLCTHNSFSHSVISLTKKSTLTRTCNNKERFCTCRSKEAFVLFRPKYSQTGFSYTGKLGSSFKE